MTYREEIGAFDILTLDDIIAAARKHVPSQYALRPWGLPELNHGVAVLQTEDALNCYMASYGQAHKEKIDEAVRSFPWKELNTEIEIIDWGCGQGLASVHFIHYLRKNNLLSKLQKVTLIEPGLPALERALLHVSKSVGQHTQIQPIQKYLPSVFNNPDCIEELHIEEPICIHLFSNILDIPQINLKKLIPTVFLIPASQEHLRCFERKGNRSSFRLRISRRKPLMLLTSSTLYGIKIRLHLRIAIHPLMFWHLLISGQVSIPTLTR